MESFSGVVGNFPMPRLQYSKCGSSPRKGQPLLNRYLFFEYDRISSCTLLNIFCMYLLRNYRCKLSLRSNGKSIGKHHVVGSRQWDWRAREKTDDDCQRLSEEECPSVTGDDDNESSGRSGGDYLMNIE